MQFIGNAKISYSDIDNRVSLSFERPVEEQDDTCGFYRIPVLDDVITIVTTLRGTPVEINFPAGELTLPEYHFLQTAHTHPVYWLRALLGDDAVWQINAGEEAFTVILDDQRQACWSAVQQLAVAHNQGWSQLLANHCDLVMH